MKKILVIGTGGLAREFTSWFSNQVEIAGYWSNTNLTEHAAFKLPGRLFTDFLTPAEAGTDLAVIAIGTPAVKAFLYEKFSALGFSFPALIHPSSLVSAAADIHEGVVISPHCVVSPNVTLNKLTYLNFSCGIGHDALIGSFVQINPGTQLGGFTHIGEGTLAGSGSTVLQGVKVGSHVTIGAGSVVFSRVADGATVMGNPAKRMRAFEK